MNSQTIEKLLQKYFDGDTTLREEQLLREFFTQDNIPSHLVSLKEMFRDLSLEKNENLHDENFDDEIMERIAEDNVISMRKRRRSFIIAASGIAASIIIMIAMFLNFNFLTKKIDDTINDPQIAYNEAKEIMMFVSTKFNKGTRQLDKIKKIDKGINNLQEIGKLNDGMEEVSKIEKYNIINDLFTNQAIP